jgi:hypothetical protein
MENFMSSVKLSLHISQEANDLMEEVCQENLLTKSEFMRKAMALMVYTMNYKKKGGHLAVLDKDDKKLADVVGI